MDANTEQGGSTTNDPETFMDPEVGSEEDPLGPEDADEEGPEPGNEDF